MIQVGAQRMLALTAAAMCCAVASACSIRSSVPTVETSATTARAPATSNTHRSAAPARPPRVRHPQRRAGTGGGTPPSLPVSTASVSIVQLQPAPGSCHARGFGPFSSPDPGCTPGAITTAVTAANVQWTICRRGYTASVRPRESVSEPEKRASLAAYGDAGPLHDYEYDHLVPLELGGAPNDPRNLWPESGASPNPKDELEERLRSMVCDGERPLAAAQREIAADWVGAYHRLVG